MSHLLVPEGQAGHLAVALEVAAHVGGEDQVDVAGSTKGVDKLVLIVLLQKQ